MSRDRPATLRPGPSPFAPPPRDWIARWQRLARRIRVPLGFLVAALYLFELGRRPAHPAAVACSLLLVLPGLALRGCASGYVRKDRQLTVAGPYAFTRNPLYLGSMLIAAGFAVALLSWLMAIVLAAGFAIVYIPVIASEERFLRGAFPAFADYCRRVPRLIPRLTPASPPQPSSASGAPAAPHQAPSASPDGDSSSSAAPGPAAFSFALYLNHREYNAVIGAALLYLSLLFLRPAVEAILRIVR